MKFVLDFSGDSAILFSVMRDTFDNLSCEEVFELNAVCDEWQADAIKVQEQELADEKKMKFVLDFWQKTLHNKTSE
jgi:hypothetical protein